MIKKLIFSVVFIFGIISPVQAQEVILMNVNKLCATLVNIPYASDNFTDDEWEEFKKCLIFMNQFSE
jgi:hypothetical protein